jgi:hypothetical protein
VAWLSRAGADLRGVFDAPSTTVRERKQLLRLLVRCSRSAETASR